MPKIPREWKEVTQEGYIYNDFDSDKAKNIDDPKPFDPAVSQYPDPYKDQSYYHQVRYGSPEVLLSKELKALEKHNAKRIPLIKSFLHRYPKGEARIKTIPSTIKKLREQYLTPRRLTSYEKKKGTVGVFDIAGGRIVTKDRASAKRMEQKVLKSYHTDRNENNDYYSYPKGDVYYAYHIGAVDPKNRKMRMEIQVKSKPMADLGEQMHPLYKKQKSMTKKQWKKAIAPFQKKAKLLFKKGY